MHRMRDLVLFLTTSAALAAGFRLETEARGDLIRARSTRSFPSIAGDIVGAQTYTYDPITRTGTFEVVNAPHLIKLGPERDSAVSLDPDQRGSLYQSLLMKLDHQGRLVEGPGNRFEIRGTVVIGDKTYEGVLLSGRPVAFGAETASRDSRTPRAFDLDVRITGGELAFAFGREAYLRINARSDSTFKGLFDVDFSSDRPQTSLRAVPPDRATPVPEPTALVLFLTTGAGVAALRWRKRLLRSMAPPRGPEPQPVAPSRRLSTTVAHRGLSRLGARPTACPGPHSQSGGRARG